MWIRYEIEMHYPVRAKKGEIKGPGGCLVKNLIGYEEGIGAAKDAVKRTCAPLDYGHVKETRYYDDEKFRQDPLKAKPLLIDSAI